VLETEGYGIVVTLREETLQAVGSGHWPEAEALLLPLLEQFPDDVEISCYLGQALFEQGKFVESDRHLLEAIDRHPENEWPGINYAWSAARRGAWPEALKRWQSLQHTFPEQWVVSNGIGESLRMLGRFDEADNILTDIVTRFPALEMPRIQRGWLSAGKGNWEEALERWQETKSLFPNAVSAWAGEAEAFLELDRLDECETLLKEAVVLFPSDAVLRGWNQQLVLKRMSPQERVLDKLHESGIESRLQSDYLDDPEIMIEITSICNFACTYCVSPMKLREKKLMSVDVFRSVLDQVVPMTRQPIHLHIDGEPTSHPNFQEMAKLVNAYGRPVRLATNGSHLDPAYLDIEMDYLISMSTSAEELAVRHKKLDFDQYIEKIALYISEWGKSPAAQNITFQIIHYPQDSAEEDAFYKGKKDAFLMEFCQTANLYDVCVEDSSVHDDVYRLKHKDKPHFVSFLKQMVSQQGLYPKDGKLVSRERTRFGFCDAPWRILAIHADGTLGACCSDLSGGTTFATDEDVKNASIKELWLSAPRIQSMRAKFLEGQVERDVCQRCLLNEQVAIVPR
jgi:organic radical activating enzyme